MQRPDSRAFRQYLRTLAHPSLRPGEKSREGARHPAPSRLDRARLALRQLRVAVAQRPLSCKALVFLHNKRRTASQSSVRVRSCGPEPRVLEPVWVPSCGGVSVGDSERRDDRPHPGILVFGSVAPEADQPAAGEDRPFECGSYGYDGGVLLLVVVWCRV